MPQQRAEKQYNTFVKGLVTEVSPLTFPENSALDISNLILDRSGKLYRRLGINYESGFSLVDDDVPDVILASTKISYHSWPTPSGNTDISLGVVRIYNKLWFVDVLTENPSANLILGGTPLTIAGIDNHDIDVTIINNNFVIVSAGSASIILLEYISNAHVSVNLIQPKVRDIWGIYESTLLIDRPSILTDAHSYNLRNQGWSDRIVNSCNVSGVDSIQCTKNKMGVYPSNADIWTFGQIEDVSSTNFQKYDPATMFRNSFDNAPAPKGRFIIDCFNRGADRQLIAGNEGLSPLATLPQDRETGSFSTVASFSGRLFYAGVQSHIVDGDKNSPNFSGVIFFSQVGTSIDNLSKCYQEADPTSKDINDIIDTDGGTIHIPEISKIHKLLATRSSVLVFAQNGIWEIVGDTGGFTATSFQASKVTSIGIESKNSITETADSIIYWAKGGIYGLTQDQISGRYSVENLSIATIQGFYNNISDIAKKYAKGFFEDTQNRIHWLYNDSDTFSEQENVNSYNKELILDLTLGCFYVNDIEIQTGRPFIASYVDIPKFVRNDTSDTVYVGDDIVLRGTDEVLTSAVGVSDTRDSNFKFLTIHNGKWTFSEYNNEFFRDWTSSDGVGYDFQSFILTGYEIYQDFMRRKQVPYLIVVMERTEDGFQSSPSGLDALHPSGCLVQAQWNFTNSIKGNKWGTAFQVYKYSRPYFPSGIDDTFDTGDRVMISKNKLRGQGRALSLKFSSQEGKDMRILGWGTTLTMGSTI